MTRRPLIAMSSLLLMAGAAEAHTGAGAVHGFLAGAIHPFSGADHLLAMVMVGLYASWRVGRTLWLVPASFLAMMAAGVLAGVAGMTLPVTEAMLALSVLVLGASVALRLQTPNALAAGVAGLFAFFHGLAHGTEMAAGTSNIGYAAGLLMASAFVIAVAIAAERALASNARLARLGGGVAAVAGLAMLGGTI